MNEKLKMFLRYPNAEIKSYTDFGNGEFINIYYAIKSVSDFEDYTQYCKLQLHSMEDMTAMDKEELIYSTFTEDFIKIKYGINIHNITKPNKSDWLREHNYDIDGLIAKGWAERIER